MLCPYCSYELTQVLDSRLAEGSEAVRRRRECQKCKKRFTTYERVELLDIKVIKKDGRNEPFKYEKLFRGIMAACEKRPVTTKQIEEVVDSIDRQLRKRGKTDITSKELGEMVSLKLKKIDKIAYIRFASVYRQFEDVSEFAKEIERLETRKKR